MLLILNLTINQLLLSILLPTNFSMLLPILNGSDHMSRNLSFFLVLNFNISSDAKLHIIGALNLNKYLCNDRECLWVCGILSLLLNVICPAIII